MLIIVDPQSGVPVYRQVMDQIKFHIASGLLAPGEELPSTRALSSDLGVNPMTISKAYSFLEMEEIVERRPGKPLVVKEADKQLLENRKLQQLEESLHAGVTVARQLGIKDQDALHLFQEMLDENKSNTLHDDMPDTSNKDMAKTSYKNKPKTLYKDKPDTLYKDKPDTPEEL